MLLAQEEPIVTSVWRTFGSPLRSPSTARGCSLLPLFSPVSAAERSAGLCQQLHTSYTQKENQCHVSPYVVRFTSPFAPRTLSPAELDDGLIRKHLLGVTRLKRLFQARNNEDSAGGEIDSIEQAREQTKKKKNSIGFRIFS